MATINKTSFPLTEEVNCGKCNGQIILHDFNSSEFISCGVCGAYQKFSKNKFLSIKNEKKKISKQPLIKIGKKGTLEGDDFKVIAYLEKEEQGTRYSWREYILYNFSKGYATLVEFDGHWSIVKGEIFYPDLTSVDFDEYRNVTYNGISFRLFNKYRPLITGMVGEFDWDILNDKIDAKEFVAPPQIVIQEKHQNGELLYYLGNYIEAKTIAEAFEIDVSLFPEKVGIGALQPSKFYQQWNSLFAISGIAIIVVLLLHLLIGYIKPEKKLLSDNYNLTPVDAKVSDTLNTALQSTGVIAPEPFESTNSHIEFKSFITPSFAIDDASSNIEFTISTNVDNNWFETTIVLVNENNNKTWEVTKGIEYYHGYEGGENWSEGSTREKIMLSNIPRGKYHLNVYPTAGDPNQVYLDIFAVANSSMWRNTLITVILLCLYPTYCWIRMRNFEKRRWSNSDFSPFST